MDDIIEIFDFCYRMDLGCGSDLWRYQGIVSHHPVLQGGSVRPSAPVFFDEATMVLTTASGRRYRIMSFLGKQEEIVAQIRSDIANKGFEIH